MSIKEFFSYQYLFQIDRVVVHQSDRALGFLGAGLLVLGVVFKLAAMYAPSSVDSKYRNIFFKLFFSIGLAEIIWYICRLEFVSFFGSHFVAFIILLIGIVWFIITLIKIIKHYSQDKQIWEKEQVRAKYLPG